LKKILGGAKNYSEEVWSNLIKEIDENGDGLIQFEEFKHAMASIFK
jgi:Ca2+-binding EF-hand superfamily protein